MKRFLVDPEVFPDQKCNPCSVFWICKGLSPRWTCWVNAHREASWSDFKPHPLTPSSQGSDESLNVRRSTDRWTWLQYRWVCFGSQCRKFSSSRQEVDGTLNRAWTVSLCVGRQILLPVLMFLVPSFVRYLWTENNQLSVTHAEVYGRLMMSPVSL